MKYKLKITPEAEVDLEEAFLWYNKRQSGLGERFLLEVKEGIDLILYNPQLTQPEYKKTRKHLIKKFPYKIIYLIQEDTIIILAVIRGSRRPARVTNRIDQFLTSEEH